MSKHVLLASFLLPPLAFGTGCDSADDAPVGDPSLETPGTGPLYAMMVQVYGPDDRTVYVHLSNTLDLGPGIDLATAREFPGVANFAAIGGRLLISSGTAPVITSFDISDDFGWIERSSVSFESFPFEDNANFYYQYILDDTTAYMPFDLTKRLIWNPTEMVIESTMEASTIPLEKDGLGLVVGGNRNAIRYDGPVQQPFYYTDENYFAIGPESLVAIYDEVTHEETGVVTLPCPAATMATQDEQGYTYYGTWDFPGTRAIFGEGPDPCVARLKPDLTLDEAWTTDLMDLTEGRYHNNFRYVGGGRAVANVLHHELIDADWEAGYDADVAARLAEGGPHWKVWLFDLVAWSAKPVEGVDVEVGSGAQFAVLDGRTFLFLPYDQWGRTKIYELDAEGRATVHSDTLGDVFKWVRVR